MREGEGSENNESCHKRLTILHGLLVCYKPAKERLVTKWSIVPSKGIWPLVSVKKRVSVKRLEVRNEKTNGFGGFISIFYELHHN